MICLRLNIRSVAALFLAVTGIYFFEKVNNDHLTTGFVGTPYLCFALSNNGYHHTAVELLLQESYPGWLYSVSKGATTIWEYWNGIKSDGLLWSDDMNSFNHYAYGAIGDWMYRKVAGLDMDTSLSDCSL